MSDILNNPLVLEGKEAEAFLKVIEQNRNKRVSKEEYERAQQAYKKLKIIY